MIKAISITIIHSSLSIIAIAVADECKPLSNKTMEWKEEMPCELVSHLHGTDPL
jgi:hypothetical protein